MPRLARSFGGLALVASCMALALHWHWHFRGSSDPLPRAPGFIEDAQALKHLSLLADPENAASASAASASAARLNGNVLSALKLARANKNVGQLVTGTGTRQAQSAAAEDHAQGEPAHCHPFPACVLPPRHPEYYRLCDVLDAWAPSDAANRFAQHSRARASTRPIPRFRFGLPAERRAAEAYKDAGLPVSRRRPCCYPCAPPPTYPSSAAAVIHVRRLPSTS